MPSRSCPPLGDGYVLLRLDHEAPPLHHVGGAPGPSPDLPVLADDPRHARAPRPPPSPGATRVGPSVGPGGGTASRYQKPIPSRMRFPKTGSEAVRSGG